MLVLHSLAYRPFLLLVTAHLCASAPIALGAARAGDIERDLAAINAVGPNGAGSAGARRAADALVAQGPKLLPRLLTAMDTSNVVAANWYRFVYERIQDHELAQSSPHFPVLEFETYVRDPSHSGRARRLALALLDRLQPGFRDHLIPGLFNDPEFRADAVAAALERGDAARRSGNVAVAKAEYSRAFDHARSAEQVAHAGRKLESLGRKVNIPAHLGLVIDWQVIGPFAAPGFSGYGRVFLPERKIDLASPVDAGSKSLHWTNLRSSDPLGTVDLIAALGATDEAVGYAYTEIESSRDRSCQLRCSADDCLAVWLNGEKVFGRAMWLNGTRLDRFVTSVPLRKGRNRLLVKACQGPHHRDPAVGNAWTFQVRFCTADGAGIPFQTVTPSTARTTDRAAKVP